MEQQRAAETAGHEYMEDEDDFDNVSKINEKNFEMATSEARRSGRSCRRGTIVRADDESFSCFPGPSGQYRCWRGRRQEPVHQRNCCERDCWGVGERGIERDKRNVDVSAPFLFMGRRSRIRGSSPPSTFPTATKPRTPGWPPWRGSSPPSTSTAATKSRTPG